MADWKLKVGMLFDSKEFEAGVQRVDKQLKLLDSELKVTQSSITGFGSASDNLKARANSLTEKIELQKTKVEGLRKAYEESVTTKGEDANATQNLEIKLNNATTALNKMETELKNVKEELKNQPSLLNNVEKGLDKLESKINKVADKMVSFGTMLTVGITTPLIAMLKAGIDSLNEEAASISKLETILRNTTDATDDQIQKYIELTQAKEKLGVVSGEALLSASQEMATYITNIDVLSTMMDVCADMTAQQYGINASMEQATNVATGLGKALANGDYSFLTKLGYGFSDAQKQMMKTGTEAQRVSTIMDVVSSSIGGVNKALTETTPGKIFQLQVAFGDLQKLLANKVMPVIDKYVPKITDLINAFLNLDSETQTVIIKMAGFAAALGPCLIVMGKIIPVVNVIPGKLISVASAFGKGSSKILEFTKSIGSKATSGISGFISKVSSIGGIGDKITSALAPVGDKITGIFEPITSKIGGALAPLTKKVQGIFGKLGTVASAGAQKLQKVASIALKLVGPTAIVGLLLVGLGLAEQQFGDVLNRYLQIAIEKGPELINGFVAKITEQLPNLINLGVSLMMTLVDVIIANVPALIDGAVAIITGLADGVIANIDTIINAIIDVILMLVDTILDNLPKLLETGLRILMALVDGIINNIDRIIDAIINIILRLIDIIVQNLPLIIEAGIKILVALITGLAKAIPQLIAAIPTIVKAIFNAFGEIDWGKIGKDIINGLVAGLKAAKDLVVNTLKNIAKGAINAFKSFFGISSPSKVFAEFGNNIDEGLALGIDDEIGTIESSMDNLIGAVNMAPDGLDYSLNGISSPSVTSKLGTITNNSSNKTVNVNLHIEHFENNREQDVEQLMSEMEFIVKREILGNGGTA